MVYQTIEGYIIKLVADDSDKEFPSGEIFITPFDEKPTVCVWADSYIYVTACKMHAEGWPVSVSARVDDKGLHVAYMISCKPVF